MNGNETALVTGAAKRIGRAIALRLAEHGFDIALHYNTSRVDAERVAREVESRSANCRLFACDLGDRQAVLELVNRVAGACPDLSVLVNNASIFERGRLLETEPDLFDRHFDINYRAPFFLTRDFARRCEHGLVINLVDTKVARNAGAYFAYTLTKKSLFEFTKMAAAQLGPAIRVNAIAPGLVLEPVGEDESYLAKRARSVPLQCHGDPTAVCHAVSYLIDNQFVTGQCLYVDGGEHLL